MRNGRTSSSLIVLFLTPLGFLPLRSAWNRVLSLTFQLGDPLALAALKSFSFDSFPSLVEGSPSHPPVPQPSSNSSYRLAQAMNREESSSPSPPARRDLLSPIWPLRAFFSLIPQNWFFLTSSKKFLHRAFFHFGPFSYPPTYLSQFEETRLVFIVLMREVFFASTPRAMIPNPRSPLGFPLSLIEWNTTLQYYTVEAFLPFSMMRAMVPGDGDSF